MNRFPDPGSSYALDERNAELSPIRDKGTISKTYKGYEPFFYNP